MGYGKHSKYGAASQIKERPWRVHPIWRGLGCIMLILIPMISFTGAYVMIDMGIISSLGIPYPPEFATYLFAVPFFGPDAYVDWMTLILTGLLILVGFAALMIIYSLLYGALGPPRYGPLDAKPERYKSTRKVKTKR